MAHVPQEHTRLVLTQPAALATDALSTATPVTQAETVSAATLQLTSDN